MSFSKLLVANRGEIAVRVIRACSELGIRTVAVFSEADENSMHRRLADEAYPIGPAPATDSYLNVENIVSAIKESGADAVHPGYGFLAESAAFARAVETAGAVWVGPSPEAMELVGDKVRAKDLARRAGVPTVPGFDGEEADDERLAEEAKRIGYPVLVKASAGGGGRGMRSVDHPEDFPEAVRAARREAEAAFGDGSVFLEKLLQDPRHVEVQVVADAHGNVIHLFERECSIQRRHQKVVEEAPSPALTPELRDEICDAAVRLAREAGYRNAGTVEFLLEGEEFFFLEINARLQVEHPVTEMVTGLDLVALQLAVAAGDPLGLRQEDVVPRGAAIEVRLYAEDEAGLPSGGRLLAFAPPEGPGLRTDAGVEAGDGVSLHYDPMLAKLICHAPDRPSAVRRLRRALRDLTVLGVETNLPLLRRIADHPAFAAGETTIRFLERHGLTEPRQQPDVPAEALLLAAIRDASLSTRASTDPFGAGPWRLGGAARLRYHAGGDERAVEVERSGAGKLKLQVGDEISIAEVLSFAGEKIQVLLDGTPISASIAVEDDDVLVALHGETYRISRSLPPGAGDAGATGSGSGASLTAPMPGTVVKVLVAEGDEVSDGQLLLVLEAMKMEQPVTAPHAGVVSSLPFDEGALVPGGAVLAELIEDEEGPPDPQTKRHA